jgi:alkyldihydroxyacetonephosphate synthase
MSGELSFWGWGYADRFPDAEARAQLGAQVQAMLGFPAGEVSEPPRLADLTLPAPRLAAPATLADFSSASTAARASHTYGKSYRDLVRGFHGDFRRPPDFVARPRNEAEVVAVLAWASQARVAVIPFGGGTSVVGGVEADIDERYRGAVSLDLRSMSALLELDSVSRAARIQAGATGPALEEQLVAHGMTLRHYPQSFEFSTLGGWIATRAGGHFATLYTHIDDLTQSIRMVTPAGPLETRRLPASGAGPSPERLLLGSEGTLGIVTEAWMRVQPRPRFRSSAPVHFTDLAPAVAATRALAQSGLYPSNCRLLDAREAALHAVAGDGSHVLLLGFESADHSTEPSMARALELAADFGGRCAEGAVHRADGEKSGGGGAAGLWRQAFFDAPYLWNVLVSLGIIVDTFETACTWDRFETLHTKVIAAVRDAMKRVCGRGFLSCRFTHVYPDGPAPYYTFLAPAIAGSELSQWAEVKQAASEAVLAAGGTITHHHAVGRVHRPFYERERPALFGAALSAAKRVLDPQGILNPGVLIG